MRVRGAAAEVAGALVLVLALAVQPAGAAVLRVPTAAFPAIQAAVDAAAPGDVVQVAKGGGAGPNGEYRENVVIEKAIRLQCLSAAVIDVSEVTTTRAGRDFSDGITVLGPAGNGARIEGCVVKFAKACTTPAAGCPSNSTEGNGILIVADSAVVKNCRVAGNESGLRVQGNGVAVAGTTVSGNLSTGLLVEGDAFRIDKNRVSGNLAGGIIVIGNGGQVRGNSISATISNHLSVTGDGNILRNNVVGGGVGGEIMATGTANLLANNATRGGIQGFMVSGDGNVLNGNKSDSAALTGFAVSGAAACGAITRNVSANSLIGMQLTCPTGAPSIHANVVTDSSQFGFMFSLNAASITANKATGNGLAGFFLTDGGDLTLTGNTASGNLGSGFVVMGTGNNVTLLRNKAIGNSWDGIDVNRPGATGIVLQANTALDNEGTGIENDAAGTAMIGNKAFRNRTDIAGKGAGGGTVGVFSGNRFLTGGAEAIAVGTGLF